MVRRIDMKIGVGLKSQFGNNVRYNNAVVGFIEDSQKKTEAIKNDTVTEKEIVTAEESKATDIETQKKYWNF